MSARIYAHPAMKVSQLHGLAQQHGLRVQPHQGRTARHRWYLLIELASAGGTPPGALLRRATQ
jgi:hypothetical protein